MNTEQKSASFGLFSKSVIPYEWRPVMALCALLLVQFTAGLWRIAHPFIDGRYHLNWEPPFWLMNAAATNAVGFLKSYFGVVSGTTVAPDGSIAIHYYSSHPQLIGPLFSLWTRFFGYAEWSPRMFALLFTMATTAILFFALKKIWGAVFAFFSCAFFTALPIIYMYGRNPNQETLVMFFLAVVFLGYIKFFQNERWGLLLLGAGLLGMMLSDWSGFVLTGVIGLILLILSFRERTVFKKIAFLIGITLILGLGLFSIQAYFQNGMPSLADFFNSYQNLWRYRAENNEVGGLPFLFWLPRQYLFLKDNFTIPLGFLGVLGVLWMTQKGIRGKKLPLAERAAFLFISAVFIGQFLYIVFLRQASYVHVYYQYFFSIPVAIGCIWLTHEITEKIFNSSIKQRAFAACSIVLILFSAWSAVHIYTRFVDKDMSGDTSDVRLLRYIGTFPTDAKIIAVGDDSTLSWFGNPNIRYYANRSIETHSFEKVPFAQYQIIPTPIVESVINYLTKENPFGTRLSISIHICSKLFCVLELKKIR